MRKVQQIKMKIHSNSTQAYALFQKLQSGEIDSASKAAQSWLHFPVFWFCAASKGEGTSVHTEYSLLF